MKDMPMKDIKETKFGLNIFCEEMLFVSALSFPRAF